MIIRSLLLLALAAAPDLAFRTQQGTQPIEPIALPPSIQQGVDLLYVDPEIAPAVRERVELLEEFGVEDKNGAPVDLFAPASPLYTSLRRGLMRYRAAWSHLPQVPLETGPMLRRGATGERVARLRERMGLPAGDRFDEALAAALQRYQEVHGLKADGVAGATTIASLNLGARHYERVLLLNLERARGLPGPNERGRYILIDAGEARLYMYEDGRLADSMKVIVGKAASPTPMMASMLRYASVNPYWNVPPDLARSLIAPKVLSQGLRHLNDERYEVLSDWTEAAQPVDPTTIDWSAVAQGTIEPRVRQLPGRGNSMGDIKFMMPNDFGIYLHDTPDKGLFAQANRWISNGCVRLEDAGRMTRWLFGRAPRSDNPDAEQRVDLDTPVPVYITYLTAEASQNGVRFRADPYGRDPELLARNAERIS